MKIAIVQPYFFPYIGYYQLINAVDKFIVYDDVNFMKKRWINRNHILIGGEPRFITVPLKKVSQNKLIKDVEIDNDSKWKQKILRSIELAYKKTPMHDTVFPLIQRVIHSEETHISRLATLSLKTVAEYLGFDTDFVDSSTVYENSPLKAQDRILDICRQESADAYINPIGGTELYSREDFLNNKVRLNFLKPSAIEYPQYHHAFVSPLSIIDVLMFNARERVREFLEQYTLV